MLFNLANRLKGVAESATLRMASATRALAAQGIKVIPFTVGELDSDPPVAAVEGLIRAAHEGFHRYTPVPGIPELRNRIAKRWKEECRVNYSPDQVVVTVGAKQAIFNLLLAVLSPGDEVIVPAPFWTSYPEMVKIAEGTPVIVHTAEKDGFKLTASALRAALTPQTKMIILNNPCNPTGALYSRDELLSLAKVLESTNVLVCADEIYEKLIYEGAFTSFASLSPDAFQRTISVNGFSKSHAMTGWRVGYAAGPKSIIDAMILLQGQSTTGTNSLAQKGAYAGFDRSSEEMTTLVQSLRRRRDRLMEILSEEETLSFIAPPAAFYLFLNVKAVLGGEMQTSEQLAFYLLQQAHVGTVPGTGFGMEGYIRLSFAVSPEEIEIGGRAIVEAVRRIERRRS